MRERDFAHKVRHFLNLGTERIERKTADRLFHGRQNALAHQRVSAAQLGLAGVGGIDLGSILPYARAIAALIGLSLAVVAADYWNSYQQALEYEEIDSALLADDLPINAYLDRGFHAWLDQHSAQQ
jgi:hypothetical protein